MYSQTKMLIFSFHFNRNRSKTLNDFAIGNVSFGALNNQKAREERPFLFTQRMARKKTFYNKLILLTYEKEKYGQDVEKSGWE